MHLEGKHDGVVNGHRYFKCNDKHGLFARPEIVNLQASKTVEIPDEEEKPAPRSRTLSIASNPNSLAFPDFDLSAAYPVAYW